jgi:hypothetical protein
MNTFNRFFWFNFSIMIGFLLGAILRLAWR